MAWTDATVENDGVRLATRDYGGTGPDLVLMHGGGRNLTDMELVVPFLTPHARVVGMDLRGHGQSDEPDAWRWDDTVTDLEAVARELGLDNPYVAGHSMGGMVAAFYAAAHPECRGAANVDGHGRGAPSFPDELLEDIERRAEQVELTSDTGDEAWVDAQIAPIRSQAEALGISWERAEPALRRSYVVEDGVYRRRPSNRFLRTFPSTGRDLFDVYRRVECPLLIVSCTEPRGSGLPEEITRTYRECLLADLTALAAERGNVSIATVATGHMVNLENPRWLADRLLDLVGRAG